MEETKEVKGTKPAKKPVRKELKVGPKENTALYRVYYDNGGELPKCLSGLFTTPEVAQNAIDNYLKNRK